MPLHFVNRLSGCRIMAINAEMKFGCHYSKRELGSGGRGSALDR
jgi:hypothetical protein